MIDIKLRNRDDLFDWGHDSRSKAILVDGKPSGHVVIAREGKFALMVTLASAYEDDAQRLGALLQPMLASAQREATPDTWP